MTSRKTSVVSSSSQASSTSSGSGSTVSEQKVAVSSPSHPPRRSQRAKKPSSKAVASLSSSSSSSSSSNDTNGDELAMWPEVPLDECQWSNEPSVVVTAHHHALRLCLDGRHAYLCQACASYDSWHMYTCPEGCEYNLCPGCVAPLRADRVQPTPSPSSSSSSLSTSSLSSSLLPSLLGALSAGPNPSLSSSSSPSSSSSLSSSPSLSSAPPDRVFAVLEQMARQQEQMVVLMQLALGGKPQTPVPSLDEGKASIGVSRSSGGGMLGDVLAALKPSVVKNNLGTTGKVVNTPKPVELKRDVQAQGFYDEELANVGDDGSLDYDDDPYAITTGKPLIEGKIRGAPWIHQRVAARWGGDWRRMVRERKWDNTRNRYEAQVVASTIHGLFAMKVPVDSDPMEQLMRRMLQLEALDDGQPKSYVDSIGDTWEYSSDKLMPRELDAIIRREAILRNKLVQSDTKLKSPKKPYFGDKKKNKKDNSKNGDDAKRTGGGKETKTAGAPAK
jgi:hypothetical protein